MALRRTLSLRSLLSARRYQQPSYRCINLHDEEKPDYSSFLNQRSFTSSFISHNLRSSSDLSFGVSIYRRTMSTSPLPVSTAVVDASQQLLETVHSFTGFNWWVSILLTTFLVRGVTIPLMIRFYKFHSWATVTLIAYEKSLKSKEQDPGYRALGLPKDLCNHTTLFPIMLTYLQPWLLINMGIAVSQMTEKVQSFSTGGALWFTDLTVPDASYIFPILSALMYWITVECDATVPGLEGFQPPLPILRKVGWCFATLTIICTIRVPQAVHCYMISSMMFTIVFMQVMKRPGVKKYLGIPEYSEYVALQLFTIPKIMKIWRLGAFMWWEPQYIGQSTFRIVETNFMYSSKQL